MEGHSKMTTFDSGQRKDDAVAENNTPPQGKGPAFGFTNTRAGKSVGQRKDDGKSTASVQPRGSTHGSSNFKVGNALKPRQRKDDGKVMANATPLQRAAHTKRMSMRN